MSWNRVAVVGAGLIKFGELFDQSYEQMAAGAFDAAVAAVDKGFEPHAGRRRVRRHPARHALGPGGHRRQHRAHRDRPRRHPVHPHRERLPVGLATRSGSARWPWRSGVHDVVLVIGVEKMRDKSAEEGLLARAAAGHPILTRGETAPVLFAPFATRHMHEFGTTREMLASVAVKNHHNGALDPYAHFQNEITIEDVLAVAAGVPPAPPARLLPADRRRRRGAPRARAERADEFTDKPVTSPASAWPPTTRTCTRRRRFTGLPATVAGRRSGPTRWPASARRDIDCAEVHDCFTITEILDIEDLGFCRQGQGRRRVARGRDRRSPAASRSTPRAGCWPRATRSAPPASRRSPSAGGSCGARPTSARSRSATATRCSTTSAAAARASRSSTSSPRTATVTAEP